MSNLQGRTRYINAVLSPLHSNSFFRYIKFYLVALCPTNKIHEVASRECVDITE